MTPERWRQLEALYDSVKGLSPAERSARLKDVDPEVRSAVDAILDEKGAGKTPADRIADHFRITETYTPRLIAAMRQAAEHTA